MKEKLLLWLKGQQQTLDQIIYEAAFEYYQKNSVKANFDFELSVCQEESFDLIKGKDLCYDRLNTPFAYSLWYHARRVNTFLSFFADALLKTAESRIEIFDLGAGTGAIQWAVGLIISGMKAIGMSTPNITVINIDTSPFMLLYGEKYLWRHFVEYYPFCKEPNMVTKYSVVSWNNPENLTLTNPWIASSYLFDMSDNKEEIAKGFDELVSTFKPTNLLLITSNQDKKVAFLKELKQKLNNEGYLTQGIYTQNHNLLFQGQLLKVSKLRQELAKKHGGKGMSNSATWDDMSFIGLALTKQQMMLSLQTGIKLFTVTERDRTKIKLSIDQLKASKPTGKPTVILGPAGCGKSVVLTERIKNIVESHDYNPHLKILVTTFNKDLVRYLGDWLEQILDAGKCKREFGKDFYGRPQQYSYFRFSNSDKYNIYVLHFDVLPTKIGSVMAKDLKFKTYKGEIEQFHLDKLKEIADDLLTESKLNKMDFESVCDPNFLFDEYHRIVYGLQCSTYKQYKVIERVGRGNPKLRTNSAKRKFVWDALIRYIKFLKSNNLDSFTLRRYRFLQKLNNPKFAFAKFDYILVDELQDCTIADYEVFYKLVKDPNNIVLAGDLAQSIRLGTTSRVPRADDEMMKRFDRILLEGSYRLPFRISECVKGLSERINSKRFKVGNNESGNVINPFKGAPPGARPLIVYGENWTETIQKLKEVIQAYKLYGFKSVSVFERDDILHLKLILNGISATSETILKAKGLEKQCVIWSTRVPVDTEKEIDEFIYTILTRTSAVLIIVLSSNIQPSYIDILKTFDRARLIYWDSSSKSKFLELCEVDNIDNEDDSEDDTPEIVIDESEEDINILND